MKLPFKKSKNTAENDKKVENKLREFVEARYPWLDFVSSRKSYSVLRFEFKINEPDFANSRVAKELGEKLNIVLAAEQCTAFLHRDRMIINVPRDNRDTLYIGNGLEELLTESKMPIHCYVGECDDGSPAVIDLIENPHLLVGGSTGSGKSVALNDIMLSLMFKYSPKEINFYILDDKNELSLYKDVPHVVDGAYDRDDFKVVLAKIEKELKTRKAKKGNMESIDEYNKTAKDKIPHLFIVFDEADTILKRGSSAAGVSDATRSLIEEVCSEGRSLGMHIIIASQKPEKRNIDTTIKTNITARLALRVACAVDSKVVLDEKGAEKLMGNGDAILKLKDSTQRIQCAYITPEEKRKAIKMLKGA